MSRLRRYETNGRTYFVTTETFENTPILFNHHDLIMDAVWTISRRTGVDLQAWVVLPDHLHLVFSTHFVPLSDVVKRIKQSFAISFLNKIGEPSGRVWQHRFWDRIIRNQAEWNALVDYIHYNPVKHGLCNQPKEWPYSSYHRLVRAGQYDENWSVTSKSWGAMASAE